METEGKKVILLLFICFGGLQACVPFDSPPSWSLTPSSSPHGRVTRDVTLGQRSTCNTGQDVPSTRVDTSERVNALIELMKAENVDAYIVPSSDEHLSEYVAPSDQRRQFLTGFSGSAGTAVLLSDGTRALWTDGRYFLAAEHQLDCQWILMKKRVEGVPTILDWLKSKLPPKSVVGSDPKLVSANEWLDYEKSLKEKEIKFEPIDANLVDQIWTVREETDEENPIEVLEAQFAGESWEKKVKKVREEMRKQEADMLVLTAMDEIAWLFNLRGGDVKYTPVFKSYAIIDNDIIRLFVDKTIGAEVDLHLHGNQCEQECVEIHSYKTIMNTLNALSSLGAVKKVILPSKYAYSGGASYAIYSSVPEDKRSFVVSPVLLMKSRKNEIEKKGMRNAHIKDAVALIDFLSLMEEEMDAGNAWDEISAATRLAEFRAEQEHFHSLSFSTISAFGSNGAIIHYKPTPETNTPITTESLYLLDSGAQYKDGTTDVTRTMHYGTPTDFQKEAYTRVLKGAIDVATLVFPKGTKDTRVDVLARRALYEIGLDYKHGTGHGIGMFLSIHESPTQMRIYGPEEHELEEGQFLSDEPGYYKDGEFGIRLETILGVVARDSKYGTEAMFGFEPITLVPFEPKLLQVALLDKKQCEFLNGYHALIREKIGPKLEEQGRIRAKAFLLQKTEPMSCAAAGSAGVTGDLKREQMMEKKKAGALQASETLPANRAVGRCLRTAMMTYVFAGGVPLLVFWLGGR